MPKSRRRRARPDYARRRYSRVTESTGRCRTAFKDATRRTPEVARVGRQRCQLCVSGRIRDRRGARVQRCLDGHPRHRHRWRFYQRRIIAARREWLRGRDWAHGRATRRCKGGSPRCCIRQNIGLTRACAQQSWASTPAPSAPRYCPSTKNKIRARFSSLNE